MAEIIFLSYGWYKNYILFCQNKLKIKHQLKSIILNATHEFRHHNIWMYCMKNDTFRIFLMITFNSVIELLFGQTLSEH